MNWDISIGRSKQLFGRLMQSAGQRMSARRLVLDGEAMEYAGRLQARYGLLKHEAQWGGHALQLKRQPASIDSDGPSPRSIRKSMSL